MEHINFSRDKKSYRNRVLVVGVEGQHLRLLPSL